jgi:hypothetical protein
LSNNSIASSATDEVSQPPLSPTTSKSSITSRVLKRMSNSLLNNKKTTSHTTSPTSSPSLPSTPEPSQPAAPTGPAVAHDLGDLNVQFPDTLLWKRRCLRVDDAGSLILSPAQGSKINDTKLGTKRFHLSEFRRPVIPDVDMQELPNSVALDLMEGGGLQFACEDRAGQGRVLEGMNFPSQNLDGCTDC